MGRKEDNIARAVEVMHTRERIRNLAIAAHIDHGKTTLCHLNHYQRRERLDGSRYRRRRLSHQSH